MRLIDQYTDWQLSQTQIFWGEIAPCDHVVQLYENDENFLDVLAGFTGSGINTGDCVIVIATTNHLKGLEERLTSLGVHVDMLIADNHYIPLNAEDCLARFMVDGWPDEALFMEFVSGIISKARQSSRKSRAFGEMVAIMWAKGYNGATVQLEHLWNKFAEKESFSLFCAYPRAGFTQGMQDSLLNICCSHSKMISVSRKKPMTEIYYRTVTADQKLVV
jgi:hypothetical protein